MRRTLHVVLLIVLPALAYAQSPIVPLATTWPARLAAGMRQGDQIAPFTVEARRDGWVIITRLNTRPDEGDGLPEKRLLVEAGDVKRWTARARVVLSPASDSISNPLFRRIPPLGKGSYFMRLDIKPDPRATTSLTFLGCFRENTGSSPSRAEIVDLLALLDSAAELAGGGAAVPPSLARPYYTSEVSCPVSPKYRFAAPRFPDDIPVAQRELTEVGMQFVVDAGGEVEAASIAFFPGTNPRLEQTARRAMAEWHYRPADWNGTPIRQLVQRTIVFDPATPTSDTVRREITVRAERDGWVRFRHSTMWGGFQEWVTPDSVDSWVTAVEALYAEGAALDRATMKPHRKFSFLGTRRGVVYNAGYSAHDTTVERGANLIACAGASVGTAFTPDAEQFARFRAAAREARALRATPDDPRRIAHAEADVACAAWLPWHRSALSGFTRVWIYPTGVYPATMKATQARAEVFASFVVDTMGIADPSTLVVMPGSDPRAVDALPASLRAFRFRPATRGGIKVPERVIQAILFEPPPTCASPLHGPACARRYSDDL